MADLFTNKLEEDIKREAPLADPVKFASLITGRDSKI